MRRTVTLAALALALSVSAGCGTGGTAATGSGSTTAAASAQPTTLDATELPAIALGPSDLPDGFKVAREGPVTPSGTLEAAYRRIFDSGLGTVGKSRVAVLASDVALFKSEQAATASLAGLLDLLTGPKASSEFASIVRVSSGVEPTRIRGGQTLATNDLGDGAVVSSATFATAAGRAEAVFLTTRVGPLHGALFMLGPAGKIDLVDAKRLAQVVVTRMQQAVAAAPVA